MYNKQNAHFMHLFIAATLILAGCAAGDSQFTADAPAGFFLGIWHGLIACPALVIGLFYDSVEIYERTNVGAWYDLGFLLGVGLFGGSGHKTRSRWWCSSKRNSSCAIDKNG